MNVTVRFFRTCCDNSNWLNLLLFGRSCPSTVQYIICCKCDVKNVDWNVDWQMQLEFFFNYTELAKLAIKAYVRGSKINLAKTLPLSGGSKGAPLPTSPSQFHAIFWEIFAKSYVGAQSWRVGAPSPTVTPGSYASVYWRKNWKISCKREIYY